MALWGKIKRLWKVADRYHSELFVAPYRASLARERRDQDDLFVLLCFSDLLGIPNPVTYYTLELLPLLYEEFHDWHRRAGFEHSPLDGIRCC